MPLKIIIFSEKIRPRETLLRSIKAMLIKVYLLPFRKEHCVSKLSY